MEEVAIATLGIGMIWCDCASLATNVAVTPAEERYTDRAMELARNWQIMYIHSETALSLSSCLCPREAVRHSISCKESLYLYPTPETIRPAELSGTTPLCSGIPGMQ